MELCIKLKMTDIPEMLVSRLWYDRKRSGMQPPQKSARCRDENLGRHPPVLSSAHMQFHSEVRSPHVKSD